MRFKISSFTKTFFGVNILSFRNVTYINRCGSRSIFSRPDIKKELSMEKLPDYYSLPRDIIEMESGKGPSIRLQEKLTMWKANKPLMRRDECNYIESFRTMIYFEEAAEHIQLENCNQENVRLHHVDEKEFYFIFEPKMKELYALMGQFEEFDLLSKDGPLVTKGQIIFKDNAKIYIELENITSWNDNEFYNIVFHNNRTFHLLQHQALDFVQSHKLFDLLINNPLYYSNRKKLEHECNYTETFVVNDLNEEQKEAVKNIVMGAYYPLPYLLYGPPGTGKTKTLVASIINIVETSRENILVCAQSNSACDEITNRLSKFLDQTQMFRLYSKSKDVKSVASSILPFSNCFGEEFKYPPLKYIYQYRVVISTLAMAGCLCRAHCKPDHFKCVIIDECASALETITFVPIAGLCSTVGKVHAKIVLAGDPKQLDAITKSEWATALGYGTSFIEQLFNFPLYKRDEDSGKFNTNYITQLVKNYRSHPAILHVSNQLFYDGALKAETTPRIADLDIQLPHLNDDFPIIFKSVQGLCVKPDDDTSSYNVEEIVEVMAFIRTLLENSDNLKQSDIGVISPYRLQCEFIRLMCKRGGFNEITVGTAEKFQGQERKIIIASTVCSRNEMLGSFVSDPQRLNVMATRAQYLLIIIGDPHTLSTNPNWAEFIKFCYNNGSLIQSDQHFTLIENLDLKKQM